MRWQDISDLKKVKNPLDFDAASSLMMSTKGEDDMKTVKEISALTGLSVRALQYYDRIGLLSPAGRTEGGYRLYDDASLERLQQILLFRELEFSLKDINRILSAPDFDRNRALEQQIGLLELKKEHIENLILFAKGILLKGTRGLKPMDFTVFDSKKMDEYAAEAKKTWEKTPAWQEYEEKRKDWKPGEGAVVERDIMALFVGFGALREGDPASEAAQKQVKALQTYITEHLYTCTDEILSGLGKMYDGGGAFTENIDAAGGPGTAHFAARAIEIYCKK